MYAKRFLVVQQKQKTLTDIFVDYDHDLDSEPWLFYLCSNHNWVAVKELKLTYIVPYNRESNGKEHGK